MAIPGMFDWNPMSQSQMDQAYLKSIIDANTGENYGARFGAGLGLSLGRMFGGQTAQEAEQNIMKDVFSQAAQEQDPVKRLQTAAALFRQKGMEGRAQQLEAQAMNMVKSQQDLTLGGMNIQSLIDERNARVQALKDKATASEEALAQRKNLASFVQRKIPDLTVEEAEALVVTQPETVKDLLKTAKTETEVVEANGRKLLINKATGATIADLGAAKKGLGAELAAGLSPLVGALAVERAKKTGAAEGEAVGKQVALIQGKFDAKTALENSLNMLRDADGNFKIYAGSYGPTQTLVAKATKGLVFDRQKAINTEEFLAEISTTVIPLLKEFGGNDSNEELKFLRRIVGGDQNLEPEAMEKIMKSAILKIDNGIKRVQEQQQATQSGAPLPTGPSRSQPKPTQRFNPATGKLEKVQ